MNGHFDIVETLLEAATPVNCPNPQLDPQPDCPLLLAALGGHFEVVKRLRIAGATIRPTSTASQSICTQIP
jgi:ankyrin repeat protein